MLTLQQMTQDLYGFTSPLIQSDCAAKYQGADAWMCLWPSYRLPFIQTQYFLNAAQFDAFQIMYDTNNIDSTYCCETAPEQQWVEQFQTQTLALFQQVPNAAIYSSSCLVHCLSCNADFWDFTVNGRSLAQQVGEWFFHDNSSPLISSCTGWDCTLQCSGGPWEPTNQQCMTTTNQCANDYMITQTGAPVSNQQSQAAIAAGNAAWEAQQKSQQTAQQGNSYENSDWAATQVQPSAAAVPAAVQAGNAAGTVGVSEPGLSQQQQQQLQALAQQLQMCTQSCQQLQQAAAQLSSCTQQCQSQNAAVVAQVQSQ